MQIEMGHLTKTFGGTVQALRGIDLTIPNGMFGLLGPNGAGKTTLMRILAGILQPTSGELTIGRSDARTEHGRREVKEILGYLPQELGMYPSLSAREFLNYVGTLKGLNDSTIRKRRVDELLELVSLSDVAGRKLKSFSGGMKRRVGIAQALLNDPKLLIVDEPTAGLDPEERIRFRNLLTELGGDRIVLLSTHIVEDIAQTCQRIAVMTHGRVVFSGTTFELARAAQGRVWSITTSGPRPTGDITITSTIHQPNGVQYRAVGMPAAQPDVVPAEPGLEESYIWLMRNQNESQHRL